MLLRKTVIIYFFLVFADNQLVASLKFHKNFPFLSHYFLISVTNKEKYTAGARTKHEKKKEKEDVYPSSQIKVYSYAKIGTGYCKLRKRRRGFQILGIK